MLDLERAFSLAGRKHSWRVVPRRFHFIGEDGTATQLELRDRDACLWAAALDDSYGLRTTYSISVLCRLLAFVDLIKNSAWRSDLVDERRRSLKVSKLLFTIAATIPLSPDARFEVEAFDRRKNSLRYSAS